MSAKKSSSPWAVAPLLFGSGACALVYQAAWFRELRLVFGASTLASAAVLGVFMAGLGVGGRLLGARADRSKNPLMLYANLELGVAVVAAVTPLVASGVRAAYVGLGGSASLGIVGATLLRLVLAAVVLGGPTVLMGGTLPAAVRAIEREDDAGRRRVALLYGVNTFGAVVGTAAATFLLFEVFGTRLTLWLACLVNALVGMLARGIARGAPAAPVEDEPTEEAGEEIEPAAPAWFPPIAAGAVGFAFMLMEIVWYRMLAPLLGGSSYTFGLVLTLALAGIGLGGAIHAFGKAPASLFGFAVSCALEALFVGLPFALGDRVAVLALLLRPVSAAGFTAQVAAWAVVAGIVVFPAAIVSGAQFPLIIGLYGRGRASVGRHVGHAYLANTVGGIVGSLAGGFGLLPLLSATGTWRFVVAVLVACAVAAIVLATRRKQHGWDRPMGLLSGVCAAAAILCLSAVGPTAAWRHTGIGAGRAHPLTSEPAIIDWERHARQWTEWQADGVESGVALISASGYAFVVNGKVDGHATGDAPTQVMSGLLGALVHGEPRRSFVIGLGTGSTAGWLGALPTMDRVDVVELEPAIEHVARVCSPVNADAMQNPKLHMTIGDAREALLVSRERYDLVFSEPSNPFRAGISSLYTREFYEAVRSRLAPRGVFLQWLQDYEVDAPAIVSVVASLGAVFGDVHAFETESGDILFLARDKPEPLDAVRMRGLIATEPYATALRVAWRTASLEGFLAHYIASPTVLQALAAKGTPNTDDENRLEYAFARTVGKQATQRDTLSMVSSRRGGVRAPITGPVAWEEVQAEAWVIQVLGGVPLRKMPPGAPPHVEAFVRALDAYTNKRRTECVTEWKAAARERPSRGEIGIVLECAAGAGDEETVQAFADRYDDPVEREIFRAELLKNKGRWAEASAALRRAFEAHRTYPWSRRNIVSDGLELAKETAGHDPASAKALYDSLAKPFSVRSNDEPRVRALLAVALVTNDPARCVEALAGFEPNTPWEREVLRSRVACYGAAGHPLAETARRELAAFEAGEPTQLGEYLPAPGR